VNEFDWSALDKAVQKVGGMPSNALVFAGKHVFDKASKHTLGVLVVHGDKELASQVSDLIEVSWGYEGKNRQRTRGELPSELDEDERANKR
jgi:hypothetical protein